MRASTHLILAASLALLLAACSSEREPAAEAAQGPAPIDAQEGAVCGMIVSDQSAPRGQVIHRDGTRAFLCSIGDLLAYLAVPSPHGTPKAVLVEVMDPGEDPMESHRGPHPWLEAGEATYVVGIPRRSIMGEPVLVYPDLATAEAVIGGTSGTTLDFEGLQRWWEGLQGSSPAAMSPAGGHHDDDS